MQERKPLRACADCGATAPTTQTSYTLISSMGWRVEVVVDERGRKVAVLRCQKCAARRKQTQR